MEVWHQHNILLSSYTFIRQTLDFVDAFDGFASITKQLCQPAIKHRNDLSLKVPSQAVHSARDSLDYSLFLELI
jgi:hypothetical protein